MAKFLSPDHPRKAAAVKFGRELSRSMRLRKVTRADFARQTGIRASLLWSWESGQHLPRIETAQELAATLSAPQLVTIVMDARKSNCVECSKVIINAAGPIRRYCSSACQNVQQKIREAKSSTRERSIRFERKVAIYEEAVNTMCFTCEPEGLCHDSGCALRVVSPLPLAIKNPKDHDIVESENHRYKRWQSDEERIKQSQRSKDWWATRTAESRHEHAKRAAGARWKKVAG